MARLDDSALYAAAYCPNDRAFSLGSGFNVERFVALEFVAALVAALILPGLLAFIFFPIATLFIIGACIEHGRNKPHAVPTPTTEVSKGGLWPVLYLIAPAAGCLGIVALLIWIWPG